MPSLLVDISGKKGKQFNLTVIVVSLSPWRVLVVIRVRHIEHNQRNPTHLSILNSETLYGLKGQVLDQAHFVFGKKGKI